MSADSAVDAKLDSEISGDRGLRTQEDESVNRRHGIEALLREIFEGHEEFLGVTPD